MTWGWRDRPLDQDAPQYFALAQSLAAGEGYTNRLSPWPDQPTCERMPGWPVLVAGVLASLPESSRDPWIIRVVGIVCLSLTGASATLLTARLGVRSSFVAGMAGIALACSPPLIFIAVSGMSEAAFLLCVLVGLLCLIGTGMKPWLGAIVLGIAVTIRTNFILVGPLAFVAYGAFPYFRRRVDAHLGRQGAIFALALFMLPIGGWIARNYNLTGQFPLLAAIEGETFLGSNNAVVARDLHYWGTWIMPDEIPGVSPKFVLAQTREDFELSRYYHDEGVRWLKENPRSYAWLVVGKLIRAFIPIPWNLHAGTLVAFGYRASIVVLAIVTLGLWWRRIDRLYLVFLLMMFLVVLSTTIVYYGNYRFTHCLLEIFLIPLIGLALDRRLSHRTLHPCDDLVERRSIGS